MPKRLTGLGVELKGPPKQSSPVTQAVFNDTCGNWIQIYQVNASKSAILTIFVNKLWMIVKTLVRI
ncbi:hypothetical protein [Mucilaginibacter sp.]|uniref:hypothetical protein n=1 Tax=Mucilaginibacter sp. TaxID=1882438 RepID=UPI00261DBEA9|nr:hypothetical protein [Mucilaginibacter sp.]